MRNGEISRLDVTRSVKDQIEVDDAGRVAHRAPAAEPGLDREKLVEKVMGRQRRPAHDDHVQEIGGLWRSIDRIGFVDGADANDPDDPGKLVERAAEMPRAFAQIRAEGDHDRFSGGRR